MASRTDEWVLQLIGKSVAGRYRLEGVLGTGGMGAVFVGVHLAIHRVVAVKILGPHLVYNASEVERFRREARRAATIRHRGIVDVLDFDIDPEVGPFLVMEHLRGATLGNQLKRFGAMPPAEVIRMGCEVLDTLGAVHANGIIHRDLKPANIFLEADGTTHRARLLDFGVSLALHGESPLTRPGFALGTLRYMAPEQARSRPLDHRADIYAMGHILRTCLTGRKPFDGIENANLIHAIIDGERRPLALTHPHLDPALCAAIDTAIAADRDLRFSAAAQFKEALEQVAMRVRAELPAATPGVPPSHTATVESSGANAIAASLYGAAAPIPHPPIAGPMEHTVLETAPIVRKRGAIRIIVAVASVIAMAAIAVIAYMFLPAEQPTHVSSPLPTSREPRAAAPPFISTEPTALPPTIPSDSPSTAPMVDAIQFQLSPITAKYLVPTVDVSVVHELELTVPSSNDPRIQRGRQALAESRLAQARETFQAILDDANASEQIRSLAQVGLGDANTLTFTLFHHQRVRTADEWWPVRAILVDLVVATWSGHYGEASYVQCDFTRNAILHDQASLALRRIIGDPRTATDPILALNWESVINTIRSEYDAAIRDYQDEASSRGDPRCAEQANRLLAVIQARAP